MKKIPKERAKTLNKAQKQTNNGICTSYIVNENTSVVSIPKEEMEDDFTAILTVGIMYGLHSIGIKDLDITVREDKKNFEIIIEK